MIAVDTNLVVRLVVATDDPSQTVKVKALFAAQPIFVPTTVLLETAWVLRRVYGVSDAVIASAFRELAGIATVHVEAPERLQAALDGVQKGLDFADALHLASSRHCEAFVTFDKAFIKAARAFAGPPVQGP